MGKHKFRAHDLSSKKSIKCMDWTFKGKIIGKAQRSASGLQVFGRQDISHMCNSLFVTIHGLGVVLNCHLAVA